MFSAGARDLGASAEPSVAPVASGGYFWVVMHRSRTYGNILTGDRIDREAALGGGDRPEPHARQGPEPPGVLDPRTGHDDAQPHAASWALTPCKANGQGCSNGTDCCGGYCADDADAGALSCRSTPQGCSQNGDKCTQTSDCCGAAAGVTCVAHRVLRAHTAVTASVLARGRSAGSRRCDLRDRRRLHAPSSARPEAARSCGNAVILRCAGTRRETRHARCDGGHRPAKPTLSIVLGSLSLAATACGGASGGDVGTTTSAVSAPSAAEKTAYS